MTILSFLVVFSCFVCISEKNVMVPDKIRRVFGLELRTLDRVDFG